MFDLQSNNSETVEHLVTHGGTEKILLRAMHPDDLPHVTAIEAQSQLDPWSQTSFRAELENSRVSQPLVAVRENEIVGYIVCWFIADEAQVATIAVKESHRRRGLGRFMLSHALQLALRHRCRRVFLEVRKSNLAARRLYESLGFVVDGLRPRYYLPGQEDAILMKKELVSESNC
ncbi:MAG: ribosomal protein S18-alanine N-acetyltransferase [bacterium]